MPSPPPPTSFLVQVIQVQILTLRLGGRGHEACFFRSAAYYLFMTRGGRDGASPPAPGCILGRPPPPLSSAPFSVCVFTNTHTWFLQRDTNEITRHSLDPHGGWGWGVGEKILVMTPCCCSDPEKQSYLSAPDAAQLSARVSGGKKKMWPPSPCSALGWKWRWWGWWWGPPV